MIALSLTKAVTTRHSVFCYLSTKCDTFLKRRRFIPVANKPKIQSGQQLRILQFNMLADGLCALRGDNGSFLHLSKAILSWSYRSKLILHEIVQYQPDVITMQECDHYHDFFAQELNRVGYDGLFAPKPQSACLEVSSNPDGCCIFYKRDRFHLISSKIIQYAVSNHQLEADDYSQALIPQNQVAIVGEFEMKSQIVSSPTRILIATTHLKAEKTLIGEKYRSVELSYLLKEIYGVLRKNTVVILAGDLNASPFPTPYPNLTYKTIMNNPYIILRSVYNYDVSNLPDDGSEAKQNPVWTTWKMRIKDNIETVVKSCIDYILYTPVTDGEVNIEVTAILDVFPESTVRDVFLPNEHYPSDHIAIGADFLISHRDDV